MMPSTQQATSFGARPGMTIDLGWLDPPPGPPADAEGNFLPLPQWLPGQPQTADWPSHIHPPRTVESKR